VITSFSAVAQENQKKWSLFIYAKTHSFYDNGVYELRKTNDASANGLGVSIHKYINNRVALFGGYDFGLADRLSYPNGLTNRAVFHQLDANISVDLLQFWRVQPYIFTGYAWNRIPDLSLLDLEKGGMNVNLGSGAKLKLTEAISLGYQINYRFSISENIPFNFRHQFGVHISPSSFKVGQKSEKNSREDELLSFRMDSVLSANDSLANALITSTEVAANRVSLDEVKLLEQHIHFLEEDNQRLLSEIRSKRHFTDSVYRTDFKSYVFVDSLNQVYAINSESLKEGYYIFTKSIDGFQNALVSKAKLKRIKDKVYVLKKGEKFSLLSWIGEDKEEANSIYQSNKDMDARIVLINL
jgi:hypothetical protein